MLKEAGYVGGENCVISCNEEVMETMMNMSDLGSEYSQYLGDGAPALCPEYQGPEEWVARLKELYPDDDF